MRSSDKLPFWYNRKLSRPQLPAISHLELLSTEGGKRMTVINAHISATGSASLAMQENGTLSAVRTDVITLQQAGICDEHLMMAEV